MTPGYRLEVNDLQSSDAMRVASRGKTLLGLNKALFYRDIVNPKDNAPAVHAGVYICRAAPLEAQQK